MNAPDPDKDRLRSTGGNRFIEPDAGRGDLMRTINDQLGDLHEWAQDSGRMLDLAEITISTKRIPSGLISVSVTADLARRGDCPTCGPTKVEPHPRRPGVQRCANCKEWLTRFGQEADRG